MDPRCRGHRRSRRGRGRAPRGTVLLIGGGDLHHSAAATRFRTLCGGPDARVVYVVTGMAESQLHTLSSVRATFRDAFGFTDPTVLHTRSRVEATSAAFVAPLRSADCVFFSGGRQWRYADAYLDTAVHDALFELLDRGGTVGGTSAGASMQASFLVRGDTSGNHALVGDHTEGFGLLRSVAVDQHVGERMREDDLAALVDCAPELLGVGLDEQTWIEVRGDTFRVGGVGQVYVHDATARPEGAGGYETLVTGDAYDMAHRTRIGGGPLAHP